MHEFQPIFSELGEWIHGGKMGDDVHLDFEMYESAFNQQYKPSNWNGNPASDSVLSEWRYTVRALRSAP